MATGKNTKQTSPAVAKKAGAALAKPTTPKSLRPIIASDLAQAAKKTDLKKPIR